MSEIKYVFQFGGNQKQEFVVKESGWDEATAADLTDLPDWTELSYKQCDNCPLANSGCTRCPVAVDIKDIAARFAHIIGYTETKVYVYSEERTYFKQTEVKLALRSLFGLVMANSRCPVLGRLSPLARSHLPFSTFEDTIRRMAGAYLTRQYYRWIDGEEPDFGFYGLDTLFKELQEVNQSLSVRLQGAASKDATFAAVMEFIQVTGNDKTIWDHLETLRPELNQGF